MRTEGREPPRELTGSIDIAAAIIGRGIVIAFDIQEESDVQGRLLGCLVKCQEVSREEILAAIDTLLRGCGLSIKDYQGFVDRNQLLGDKYT